MSVTPLHPHQDTFEIITLKSGVKSLRSIERKETFHAATGPLEEANTLHVGQQHLTERCVQFPRFVIWDVGFGAAANAVAAIEALTAAQVLKGSNHQVEIHSFDRSLSAIEYASAHSQELEYLAPHAEELKVLLRDGTVQLTAHITWTLHLGDFREQARARTFPSPHAIFYDPYSPATNPEMWTLEHFKALHAALDPAVPCLWTNYTRSTSVRVALLLAGFTVGKGCTTGEKVETTVASNQSSLIDDPLEVSWLGRVKISSNAAPLKETVYTKSPISEADYALLQKCPQFLS